MPPNTMLQVALERHWEIVRRFWNFVVRSFVRKFGDLRKVVGRNCDLHPLYLRVQVLTRNISSGLGIVRKFGDLVVRNFVT